MNGDLIAREIIQKAGLPTNAQLTRVGGGFSDASVWRVDSSSGSFALKQYPASFDTSRLQAIHELLTQARQSGITVLPEVQRFTNLQSCLEHAGAIWDLVGWRPGVAALASAPTTERLTAVGSILGRLHAIWAGKSESSSTCPAIARRLAAFADWTTVRKKQSPFELTEQIRTAINRHNVALHAELIQWSNRSVTVQPCLCDCWHAHFLFAGNQITGLIDHAAVRIDHPAGDLSRLLGSMDLKIQQREAILETYEQYRPLTLDARQLMRVLETTGIIGSLIRWFKYVSSGRPLTPQGAERIGYLLQRAHSLN